jgi:hypothetical protein
MKPGDIVQIGGQTDVEALVLAVNRNRAEVLVSMCSRVESKANTKFKMSSETFVYPSIQGLFSKNQLTVIRGLSLENLPRLISSALSWPALTSIEKKSLSESDFQFEITLGTAELDNPEEFEKQLASFSFLCNRFHKSRAYPVQFAPNYLTDRILDVSSKMTLKDIDSMSLGLFTRNDVAKTIKTFHNRVGQDSTRGYARLLLRRAVELKTLAPKPNHQARDHTEDYSQYFEFMGAEGLETLTVIHSGNRKSSEYLKVRRGQMMLHLEKI